VVAEAHVVAPAPLRVARPAHVAQLLQQDWRRVWILTPSVFLVVRLRRPPQQALAAVVVVPAEVVALVLDEVVVALHKVALRLPLQAAC